VYLKYKDNPKVIFISHTVNPETDSVTVLHAYAQTLDADSKQWHFVTGTKKMLYDVARQQYMLNNDEGNGDAEDFIHTQMMALVDTESRIRGFYDGTKPNEMKDLTDAIGDLLEEN
jgi:protein SCO1/2